MNLSRSAALRLAEIVFELGATHPLIPIYVAPQSLSLSEIFLRFEDRLTKSTNIQIGLQNVYGKAHGAFTGEISPQLAKEFGVSFAIIGHSERRHTFGEEENQIRLRLNGALSEGVAVILCIGETLEERQSNKTLSVVNAQLDVLKTGMSDRLNEYRSHSKTSSKKLPPLIIAYEPVWAIGTGLTPSLDDIHEVHGAIRTILQSISKETDVALAPILYGGSVNEKNFHEIIKVPEVAGGLIGGASIKEESLRAIVEITRTL